MNYGWNVQTDLTFGDLTRDFYYANLLTENIMAENTAELRSLLEGNKANPNTVVPERGVAPLHLLAGLENEDFSSKFILQVILKNHGDPNVRSEEGLTPVHVAAMWGRCRVLELLLDNGGDPELIDYKMLLNAEEYALREQQWKAYGILCAFTVMAEGEDQLGKYLKDNSYGSKISREYSNFNKEMKPLKNKYLLKLKDKATITYPEENPSSTDSENSCLYYTVRKNKTIRKKNQTNNELISVPNAWSKNTTTSLKLNKGTLDTITRHRRKTNIYESIRPRRTANKVYPRNKRTNNYSTKVNPNKFSLHEDKVQRDDELHIHESEWSENSTKSLKLNEGALGTIKRHRRKTVDKVCQRNKRTNNYPKKENPYKLSLYGDNVSESCDWIRKSVESIKLNKNALNTIRNQRLHSKIYQTEGLGEDPLKPREKISPLYEESETCDWVDPMNSGTFDEYSLNKINIHRARTTIYKNEDSGKHSIETVPPKLPKRNKKVCHKNKENSEMYLCSYAEESVRYNGSQGRSQYISSGPSDVNSSNFDEEGIINKGRICKMSRMYLFMLNKRHIYKKIK